jgi:hypothetical protein
MTRIYEEEVIVSIRASGAAARRLAEALATALAFYAYPPQDAGRAADYYVADGGHKARRALALLKEAQDG